MGEVWSVFVETNVFNPSNVFATYPPVARS
jgi:hypothetical protein